MTLIEFSKKKEARKTNLLLLNTQIYQSHEVKYMEAKLYLNLHHKDLMTVIAGNMSTNYALYI